MKPLYPINEAIDNLIANSLDEETGEMILTDEQLATALDSLRLEFDDGITSLRNEFINLNAYAEALKAEKQSLEKRQKTAERQADRVKRFLAYLLKGEKYQNGTVSITYRKSTEAVIDEQFISWAEQNAPGLLKYEEPKPRKMDIKNALKAGKEIPFTHLETRNNIQVK